MSSSPQTLKISLVVCTYNNSLSLSNTLESIRQLDIPACVDFELCLIDNNSSDDTRRICHEFQSNAPFFVRYFFEPRQGLSHARNRGLRQAKGDAIVFTDDDVLVPKDWISRYANSFLELNADAVYGRICPDWRGRKPDFFTPALNHVYALLDYGPTKFVVTEQWQELYGANFAVKKSLLLELGGFDPRLGRTKNALFIGEERQIFLALFENDKRIVYDPEIAVLHVIAEDRKEEAFLHKYFHDIAASLVMMDRLQERHWIFRIPRYRWREFFQLFVTLPPRLLWNALLGRRSRSLHVALKFRMMLRMISLYRHGDG